MTKTTQEMCAVSAAPSASERVQPGVIPAGAPLRFQWRGCEYRVTDILTSWVETGPWWHELQQTLASGGPATRHRARVGRGAAGGSAVATVTTGGVATGGVATAAPPMERRVWQVEAVRHPRGSQLGVYELAQESDTGRWWLTRVWD